MFTPIEAKGEFLAPLATKNALHSEFVQSQTKMIIAALKNIDEGKGKWRSGTYIPAVSAADILRVDHATSAQLLSNLDFIAANNAAMLAWMQSSILVEVGQDKSVEIAGEMNINKGLPLTALKSLHHFAYAMTSPAYRRGDREKEAVPVFFIAYIDEIPVPSGKMLAELNIVRYYTWPGDRSLRAHILKIALSEGLSYIDVARRARRLELRAESSDPRSWLQKTMAAPKPDETMTAMEIALDIQMILAVDAEFKKEGKDRPLIWPDAKANTFMWPEMTVLELGSDESGSEPQHWTRKGV
jgi:hypothetical protein